MFCVIDQNTAQRHVHGMNIHMCATGAIHAAQYSIFHTANWLYKLINFWKNKKNGIKPKKNDFNTHYINPMAESLCHLIHTYLCCMAQSFTSLSLFVIWAARQNGHIHQPVYPQQWEQKPGVVDNTFWDPCPHASWSWTWAEHKHTHKLCHQAIFTMVHTELGFNFLGSYIAHVMSNSQQVAASSYHTNRESRVLH